MATSDLNEGSARPGRSSGQADDEGQLQRLLRDIDRLADQLRKVRSGTTERSGSEAQIRALEATLRTKWEAVRSLRARRGQPGGPPGLSRPRLSRGPGDIDR